MQSMIRHLTTFAVIGVIAVPALADQNEGFYVGADIGVGHANVSTSSSGSASGSGTAWGLFEGYQLNQNFAAELNIGGVTGVSVSNFNIKARASLLSGSVLGIAPIDDQFSAFGRVGIVNIGSRAEDSAGNSYSSSHAKALLGVGGSYAIQPGLNVRAEYDWLGRSNVDSFGDTAQYSSLTIGLSYAF